jgi:hypothetical protein
MSGTSSTKVGPAPPETSSTTVGPTLPVTTSTRSETSSTVEGPTLPVTTSTTSETRSTTKGPTAFEASLKPVTFTAALVSESRASEANSILLSSSSFYGSNKVSRPTVPITAVSPIPQCSQVKIDKRRRRGYTAVLTSSPYKVTLEQQKEMAEKGKKKRKNPAADKSDEKHQESKTKKRKKNKLDDTAENTFTRRRGNMSSHATRRLTTIQSEPMQGNDSAAATETDAACLYCCGQFSECVRGEKWIRCRSCNHWSHVECAGTAKRSFVCDMCN